MAKDEVGSFLEKWSDIIHKMPLKGHVMEPTPEWWRHAASIVCGHDFVQAWPEDKQAEFELFVREVIRTTEPRRHSP